MNYVTFDNFHRMCFVQITRSQGTSLGEGFREGDLESRDLVHVPKGRGREYRTLVLYSNLCSWGGVRVGLRARMYPHPKWFLIHMHAHT